MAELIKVNQEKETATFKLAASNKVSWDEMAVAIFKEVKDDKYFCNFFNLRWYDDEWSYDRFVVPVYTPFANIKRSVKVSDRYGRWEHEIDNPFLTYVSVSRKYKSKTFLRSTKGDGNYDFEIIHSDPYKTATYDIPEGVYELSFEVIFGFASWRAFPRTNWVGHTRYQERWDRCGEQYNYPWQTFVPEEYKLPKWSYDESTASQIQKATKLVANGNNIEYPLVDYPNYVVEVDPRVLEYDECYTDIHNNPYATFHFWNREVWVGIPRDLQQEEKIYVRFYMYNEIWALGKESLGGDPLHVHSHVFTAEKYQNFLSEEPGEKKHWVKY